jgi:hypothetical protein
VEVAGSGRAMARDDPVELSGGRNGNVVLEDRLVALS